jgi:hypothetical protein
MEVYDPSGSTEITQLHAPRLDSLDGKKIGLLSNDAWQAHRTLPLVGQMIKAEFPTAEIVPYEEFPMGNGNWVSTRSSSATPLEGIAQQHAAVLPLD